MDTVLDERRKHLATIVCSALILNCLEEGLYPSWDAQNMNSVRLAESLGYEYDHEYIAYEVRKQNMNIEEQFNLIANEYDINRRKFIPCFDDYYIASTKLILSSIAKPNSVLDLGAGTGLLSYYWYRECDDANYVLVDIADDMLSISRRRFEGIQNVRHMVLDYTKQFPEDSYDAVISALSIHHLSDVQKVELFQKIYDKLPAGGVFVNYDQFCGNTSEISKKIDAYWEKQLHSSGLDDRNIELWKERRKLDRECSVETELAMLKNCQFRNVQCVYSYHKFSVIVAQK